VLFIPSGAFEIHGLSALSAPGVLTATGYFGNVCIFRVLAILATVVAITFSRAVANTMCTFVVVCHAIPLLFDPFCLEASGQC
jgi:branched-subunit amino acid transport protein